MSEPGETDNLVVRQHERHKCDLPAKTCVAPESEGGVVLSAGGQGQGAADVEVRIIDCSGGGVGIRSGVFFPKRCMLSVRVDGGPGGPIQTTVCVQRVSMLDRGPAYYLGTSIAPGAKSAEGLRMLLALVRSIPADTPQPKETARA